MSRKPWAIYIRVSTPDQGEKYSPQSQRKTLLAKAASIGVDVPEQYIFEDHQTGKNDDRPRFQAMLAAAKAGVIGGVLALCLDRVARNVSDAVDFRRGLKKLDVGLDFAHYTFDDSPSGRFMYNSFAAIAEYEGEIIITRTCKGRLEKAQDGFLNSGERDTYGYDYVTTGKVGERGRRRERKEGRLVINEIEAAVVRRAFQLYDAGVLSSNGIAKLFNREGIVAKRGGMWSAFMVRRMLGHRIYTGIAVTTVKGEDLKPNVVEIAVPHIITVEQFERVQVRLRNGRKRGGRPSLQKCLFWKLIQCAKCAKNWHIHSGPSYACSNVHYITKERQCFTVKRRAHAVDAAVWRALVAACNRETLYKLAQEFQRAQGMKAKAKGVESFDARRRRLTARYAQAEAILFKPGIPQRTLDKAAEALKEIEAERLALEVEARQANVMALPSRNRVEEIGEAMADEIHHLDTFEKKRGFVEKLVDRVETDGNTFAVYCRIPVEAASENWQRGVNGETISFPFIVRGSLREAAA